MELVIFDLDDVLYNYDFDWRLEQFALAAKKPVSKIKELWIDSGWEAAAEAGKYKNGADYLLEFNRLIDAKISLDEWVNLRKAALNPNLPNLELAKALKEKSVKIAILTNNGALLGETINSVAPELRSIFGENIHCSSQFDEAKPNPEVYRRICEYYAVSPSKALFVDDKLENIIGARKIGMKAIQYTKGIDLAKEIEKVQKIEIIRDPLDSPEIQQLLDTHLQTMFSTSPKESCHAFDIEGLKQKNIKFWSLHYEQNLAGCGALKLFGDNCGEVKSMHVYSKYRGMGFSKSILETILQEAQICGLHTLYLETGTHKDFQPAHKLYLSYGFQYRGPFGDYIMDPHSAFFEKIL